MVRRLDEGREGALDFFAPRQVFDLCGAAFLGHKDVVQAVDEGPRVSRLGEISEVGLVATNLKDRTKSITASEDLVGNKQLFNRSTR